MARMDVDYEYEDLGGSKKSPTIVKKGGWLGKIVALLLGLVIGLVAGLGGLVGAGFYIVTQMKIKDAANTVGSLSGIEIPLSDYLSDEYAEMTLLGLFNGASQTFSKIGEGKGTLDDLNNISPFVGTFITQKGGLVDMLASFGIETTAEELMSKYIVKKVATVERDDQYLTDFLLLKMNEIPFAQFIQTLGFPGNEMITILCYGVEGVDYKIEDGKYVMLGDSKALTVGDFMSAELDNRIEKLPLDSIMGTPEDEIMATLFYGASHRYTQTESGNVIMNQVFYTYDGEHFYDDNGDKLALQSATPVSGEENAYLLKFKDGTEQIARLSTGNKYLAFTTDGTEIRYPKTTVGDLDGEAENLINSITLEAALQLDEDSHAILQSIAYGENGEKRTIKDLREKNTELINEIELSDIIPADTEDTIVMYLLYGKENVHYSVDTEGEIIPLQKRVALYDGKVFNEYGELIENATPNGTESYTQDGETYDLIADGSLGTVQVKITDGDTTTKHDATLYYVSQGGENLYYEPTTIGDMQNAEMLSSLTGRLQLKDVMDVGDHTLLKHLGEETIDDLPEAINALTIDDVFGEHFHYRTYNPATGAYTSYRENGNHQPIDEEGNLVEGAYMVDINNQSVDSNNDGIITREEADKALTGTWKYLLMDRKADGTFEIDHHHTLTEMDGMVEYMSNNVQTATIRELKLDGIVKTLKDETLDKEIVHIPNLDAEIASKEHIGDLTVEQLTLYMSTMLDFISEMT